MLYKTSQYNCTKIAEKVAIFNTFSGGMAVLSGDEYGKLQRVEDLSDTDSDVLGWLKLGFIVEIDKDEAAIVNYCRYRDTFLKNKPIYRILTTSACNARCFYCYEQGRPIQSMSKETAADAADFIIRSSEDAEVITLNWFGGEPLLNPDVITLITQRITNAIKGKSVNSTLITNASLFSNELIRLAKTTWNLTNIQISLDGMGGVHERRKSYVDKFNTFEKTIEIVDLLLSSGFNISLRLNYDKDNIEDIVQLIYFIKDTLGNPNNLSCYTYPLFKSGSCKDKSYVIEDEIQVYEPIVKDALTICGYYNPVKILPRRTTACFATDPYSYVINTDGLLYKCTMDMSDTTRAVGNIWEGIQIKGPFLNWTTPVLSKQCHECNLLPICQGGCRAGQLKYMDMNDCAIKRQSVEYTLNHLLKTEIL